jgi:hypothetical protein
LQVYYVSLAQVYSDAQLQVNIAVLTQVYYGKACTRIVLQNSEKLANNERPDYQSLKWRKSQKSFSGKNPLSAFAEKSMRYSPVSEVMLVYN